MNSNNYFGAAIIGKDEIEVCIGEAYRKNSNPASKLKWEMRIFSGTPDEAWIEVTDVFEVSKKARCCIKHPDEAAPHRDFNLNIALITDGDLEETTWMEADILHEKHLGFAVATNCYYDMHCDYLVNFQADECYLREKDDGVLKIVHAPVDVD